MDDHREIGEPVSGSKVLDLLGYKPNTTGFSEEQLHPWSPHPLQAMDFPLLKVWDKGKRSHMNGPGRKIVNSQDRLDTKERRVSSLKICLTDNFELSPYISFRRHPDSIVETVKSIQNQGKKGPFMVTVINPNVRLQKGRPVLNAFDEFQHYELHQLVGVENMDDIFKNWYLCPWLAEEEVVGHWSWEELSQNKDWYENIVMPAYRKHVQEHSTPSLDEVSSGMSKAMEALQVQRTVPSSTNRDANAAPIRGPTGRSCYPPNNNELVELVKAQAKKAEAKKAATGTSDADADADTDNTRVDHFCWHLINE